MDWRPIETAPAYEAVLIYAPPFAPMQGTKSGRYGTWMVGARSIVGRDLPAGIEPTHWMPLPPPPDLIPVRNAPPPKEEGVGFVGEVQGQMKEADREFDRREKTIRERLRRNGRPPWEEG